MFRNLYLEFYKYIKIIGSILLMVSEISKILTIFDYFQKIKLKTLGTFYLFFDVRLKMGHIHIFTKYVNLFYLHIFLYKLHLFSIFYR